ncbi:MAG: hypothetical protein V1770_06800 [bacterium]
MKEVKNFFPLDVSCEEKAQELISALTLYPPEGKPRKDVIREIREDIARAQKEMEAKGGEV